MNVLLTLYDQEEEEIPPESGKEGKNEAQKDQSTNESKDDSEKSTNEERSQEKTEESGNKADPMVGSATCSVCYVPQTVAAWL